MSPYVEPPFVGEMNRTREMLAAWGARRSAEKAGKARRQAEEPEGPATVFAASTATTVRKAARRVNARRKR